MTWRDAERDFESPVLGDTTLSRLFEETRYGEYPVTDDRTDRAERALRSVERGGAE
jgi:hypothetical protein